MLYLKRLIVGGMERVFEVARNFRNEGVHAHNPEFTMLELYEAQADYSRMMEITERLFEACAVAVTGGTDVTFRGETYSLAAPFERRRYADLFREANGFDFDDEAAVAAKAAELGLKDPGDRWKLMNDVFEATAEKSLTGPILVTTTRWPSARSPSSPPTIRGSRALRGLHRGDGAGQRLQRAQRPRGAAPPLRRAGGQQGP